MSKVSETDTVSSGRKAAGETLGVSPSNDIVCHSWVGVHLEDETMVHVDLCGAAYGSFDYKLVPLVEAASNCQLEAGNDALKSYGGYEVPVTIREVPNSQICLSSDNPSAIDVSSDSPCQIQDFPQFLLRWPKSNDAGRFLGTAMQIRKEKETTCDLQTIVPLEVHPLSAPCPADRIDLTLTRLLLDHIATKCIKEGMLDGVGEQGCFWTQAQMFSANQLTSQLIHHFKVGAFVSVTGLQTQRRLNGKTGKITTSFFRGKDKVMRCGVQVFPPRNCWVKIF